MVFLQLVPSAAIKRVASALASSSMYSIGVSISLALSLLAGIRPPATFTPTFRSEDTLLLEFAASVSTRGAVIEVTDPFFAFTVGLVVSHLPLVPSSLSD